MIQCGYSMSNLRLQIHVSDHAVVKYTKNWVRSVENVVVQTKVALRACSTYDYFSHGAITSRTCTHFIPIELSQLGQGSSHGFGRSFVLLGWHHWRKIRFY